MNYRIAAVLTGFLIPIVFMVTFTKQSNRNSSTLCLHSNTSDKLRLRITTENKVLYADFIDSETTSDFIKLLPLTLEMDDLNGREKYSGISRELSKEGNIKTTSREGDISYWLGGGVAIFLQ